MHDFTPRFPRSVSGRDFRVPLDHPDIEAIARRIDRLYRAAPLTNEDRGRLLKIYEGLEQVDYCLARRLRTQRLPITDLSPLFWDDDRYPTSDAWGCDGVEAKAGWVWRVHDFVERLERRYDPTEHNDAPMEGEDI